MSARTIVAFAFAGALALQPAAAQMGKLPDDAVLSTLIIGTWVTPPDSPDFEGVATSETYAADGTYTYREYADKNCRTVTGTQTTKWYVWDGVLVTQYAQGKELKDEIVSMESGRIVLRSLDDGLTFFRTRSTTCPAARLP